jgi:hypothetical protein
MSPPPIPERLAPLMWRKPAFVWIPLALALAIGWPAILFLEAPNWQRMALTLSAATFVCALISLGAAWALGRAPKARRIVMLHVVLAGALVLLAAPFLTTPRLDVGSALAVTPLAFLIGLPILLVSGLLFTWIAFTAPRKRAVDAGAHDVQPFA